MVSPLCASCAPRRMPGSATAGALAALLAVSGAFASDLRGLRNEDDINAHLLTVAIADGIRKGCDRIDARLWRGYSFLRSIHSAALELGYSREQIKSYVTDDKEKDAMRGRRDAYYRENGADPEDADSLCALGRREIGDETQVGRLLWEN